MDPMWLPTYAAQVHQQLMSNEAWARLFERKAVLVPVPGSNAAPPPWVTERLAAALHGIGLAGTVWTGLRRVRPVRKSATALSADRPTVRQHYDSLAITTEPPHSTRPDRIVLIDDVITKGRTMFAAALRLHEAFPNADIRAFALVRTMGLLPDITHAFEPCRGTLEWARGDVHREP